jgi:deoxyribodipyrimidine photo-lyase
MSATLVWFRLDLRLADNPALRAAVSRRGAVIPAFIWAPEEEGSWPPGAASRWWLHHSLARLDEALRERGSRLILRRGPALATLLCLAQETRATTILWNRRYEPALVARDALVKRSLEADDLATQSFNSALLFEPWTLKTVAGKPFQVFTPFWRACLAMPEPAAPAGTPRKLPTPARWPASEPLASFDLLPKPDWAAGLRAAWQPGEASATRQLRSFVQKALLNYPSTHDLPTQWGTSRLSPHLHFGEIGPRQVWHAVRAAVGPSDARKTRDAAEIYLRQLGWREFAHHLLVHFPHTTDQPLRGNFARFEWSHNRTPLQAWQNGRTGYPLADAGMRELWTTGWMHNRVRMVVASFLVKDLLLPWQDGARWFWDTLVDADLANNTLGWQWSAGCGADAAPFFRIFNPVMQSQKFDPAGEYIRRWVPELAGLPARWLHQPWRAPAEVLRAAGLTLGKTYPAPIVDHTQARRLALAAFRAIRKHAQGVR